MTKLQLSFAIGNYDRTRALIDGSVTIDGVDPVYMTLVPEEIFFRAFRAAEFDICELSLSSYAIQTARDERLTLRYPHSFRGRSAIPLFTYAPTALDAPKTSRVKKLVCPNTN
jgi:4,5-dihydroxyphthalate decarboxylase